MPIEYKDIYSPPVPDQGKIPASMKAVKRWVCWGGDKVPVNGNRKNSSGFYTGAASTKPETWISFEEAMSLIGKAAYVSGEYFHIVGIGFVVGDGWFCLDADGGKGHKREPVPQIVIDDLCRQLKTYCEMSLSGCGCHSFGQCDFIAEKGKESYSESREKYAIEFFTRRWFIALTGNMVPGSGADAIECSEAARQIYEEYVLTPCNQREAAEKAKQQERKYSMNEDPSAQAEFFRLNYREILNSADPDHFKRSNPGPGEYSWIGALKALQAAGIPREDIYDWCRKGSTFAGEKDIDKVLDENKSPTSTASVAAIVKDATDNGWRPDPDKLTGEYKEAHEQRLQAEKDLDEIGKKAAVWSLCKKHGIEYRKTISCTYDFDGSVQSLYDTETGEILYQVEKGVSITTVPEKEKEQQSETESASSKKQLTVSGYADVEIKPTDYLFFPWFPRGKLVILQGDSGASKSSVMYAVGARVSAGIDLLGVPCEDPGKVMFLTVEDDPSDIKTAFIDSGGNLENLRRVTDREIIAKLDLSEGGAKTLDAIIAGEDLKLLVLDPIQQFLGGDMNKANETRPQMARLMNIAAERAMCIVLISHTGKDTSKSALHRGLGSVDIGASTRSMLQVVTDPEDENYKILFTVKNNTAAYNDTKKAIRYTLEDHPNPTGAINGKRQHFHGHAEFVEIMPEYNERIFAKQRRKSDEAEMEEGLLQFGYDKDPLVLTARQLIAENPEGLFIATDDLIRRITEYAGFCPYEQSKDKSAGIYGRVAKIRKLMIENDSIQPDIQSGPRYAKPYHWRGEIYEPPRTGKARGIHFTPVNGGKSGWQQTII